MSPTSYQTAPPRGGPVIVPVLVSLEQSGRSAHRRFIKTHTPLDGLPWDERITDIDVGRDPRDGALSMAHHMNNMNFDNLFGAQSSTLAEHGERKPRERNAG